jgi:LPXTG-motif cell wall-anchored protein
VNHIPSRSSRKRLRRLAVLATGALLGLGGMLAIAAPASAHYSTVDGTPDCDTKTGEWVVDWTVNANNLVPRGVSTFQLVEIDAKPVGTIDGIAKDTDYPVADLLHGKQRLPGTATSASLSVRAKWGDGYEETKPAGKEIALGGPCTKEQPPPGQPKPHASFKSACDGSVTVTLINSKRATADATFTVTGTGDFSKEVTVEPGKSTQVVVPAANAAHIVVKSGTKEFKGRFKAPKDCAPVKVASRSDCDSLTIGIENPEGNAPVEATLTPKGGEARKVTVAPGETKEVKFDAEEGTVVTVAIGKDSADVPWEKPENCESPSPAPGGGGGGPTLPTTGASIGTAVGIAVVLLAAGTGLFFFFRRRRIRFTA